jgi:hypothetical protein
MVLVELEAGISVEELIDELQTLDPEAVVVTTADYGDISHTTQILPVRSVRAIGDHEHVVESGYSHSGMSLVSDDTDNGDDDDEEEETEGVSERNVVILSMEVF